MRRPGKDLKRSVANKTGVILSQAGGIPVSSEHRRDDGAESTQLRLHCVRVLPCRTMRVGPIVRGSSATSVVVNAQADAIIK